MHSLLSRFPVGAKAFAIACLFLLLALRVANAYYYHPDETDKFAGLGEMNGIPYVRYKDFATKWRLVTARYRKDTREIRFVYGNEKAVAALLANAKEYPNGAVFAKVAVYSEEDPRFTSSDVPSGTARVQYMVRDRKRYASTSGWGYALFNEQGRTFPEDPVMKTKACAACHNLATDAGFIFSQPARFLFPSWQSSAQAALGRLAFHQVSRERLPPAIRDAMPANSIAARVVDSSVIKDVFQGTLDELVPALAEESKAKGMPAAFISGDGIRFTLLWAERGSAECGSSLQFHRLTTSLNDKGSHASPTLRSSKFCDPPRSD